MRRRLFRNRISFTLAYLLHYIRVISSGLSTRLLNHYYTRCTEQEPKTDRKEMIGKRDEFWGGSGKQSALEPRWLRAADFSRGGFQPPETRCVHCVKPCVAFVTRCVWSLEFVFLRSQTQWVCEILCQITDKIKAEQGRRFYGSWWLTCCL